MVEGLINLRRRNKWFSPFSPNLVLNYLCSYPHSIQVKFTSRATWKMPSLEEFIESLTQEQTKLINMGKIKGPKEHALTVQDGNHQYQKYKYKDKRKSHANPKKEGYSKPFTDASDPKVEREEKGRNAHTAVNDSI
jgi:hypothetical protein